MLLTNAWKITWNISESDNWNIKTITMMKKYLLLSLIFIICLSANGQNKPSKFSKKCTENNNKGVEYYNAHNFKKALHYFEKTISMLEERNVFDTITFFNAALAAFNCKKFDKAIRYYNRCIQHKYKLAECYLDISDAYRGINDLYDAEKWLKEAEKLLPKEKNKRLIIQLANLYLAKKQFDTALIYIEIAITLKPNFAELYFAKGNIYERMGFRNQAIQSYKQVLNIDSANYDANYNLASLYYNHAAELYKELKNIPKSQPKIENDMVLMIKNEFLNALPYFENSYRIKQNDKSANKCLIYVYKKLNMKDKEVALDKSVLIEILGKSIVKSE